jgi:hypothetical protein
MLLDLAKQYSDIIQRLEVERFRVVGTSYELRATIVLTDGSKLFVKDYLFLDGTRKYAYHWQDQEGRLISRWDNAPHWKDLKSYPHHRHVSEEAVVESSDVRALEDALKHIRQQFQPKSDVVNADPTGEE